MSHGNTEGELSQARRRLVRRLSDRKQRPREAMVLVEGPRALATALDCGARFRFVLASPYALREWGPLMERLREAGVQVTALPAAEMRGLADTEAPQGVLGVAEEPRPGIPAPRAGSEERVLVLDAVQDPGNAGTLVRAAAAFGVHRIFALDGTVDPWNPKAVRAAAGLTFHRPLHRATAAKALEWLAASDLPLLVADAGGRDVREGILAHAAGRPGTGPSGYALVIGNEGAGPRAELLDRADALVSIPLAAGVESLNAAMAGTVLLWALGPQLEAGSPARHDPPPHDLE